MRTTEIDPTRIQPTERRAIVKRDPAPEKRGVIHLPKHEDRYTFEGTVVAINEPMGGEAEGVDKGDRVWFSSYVGEDDSRFFRWKGEDYVLIPTEAILAVAL